MNSGRGRGRPKKNAGRVTTINPETDDYFKTLDKGGGPTDPFVGFSEVIEQVYRGSIPAKEETKIEEP